MFIRNTISGVSLMSQKIDRRGFLKAAPAASAAAYSGLFTRADGQTSSTASVRIGTASYTPVRDYPIRLSIAKSPNLQKTLDFPAGPNIVGEMISGLIACISAFFSAFSRHRDLALENLALRQQLAIFNRRHPRPSLRSTTVSAALLQKIF